MFQQGDILKVNRGFYFHYGVFAGDNKVVHFSAPRGESETNPLTADIIEVTLDEFAKGDPPEVDMHYAPAFPPEDIVARARMMIGTQRGRYNLIGNNCEHFANWCRTGETKSHQSETAGEAARGLSDTIGKILTAFEEIRSDIGQKYYDDILLKHGQIFCLLR